MPHCFVLCDSVLSRALCPWSRCSSIWQFVESPALVLHVKGGTTKAPAYFIHDLRNKAVVDNGWPGAFWEHCRLKCKHKHNRFVVFRNLPGSSQTALPVYYICSQELEQLNVLRSCFHALDQNERDSFLLQVKLHKLVLFIVKNEWQLWHCDHLSIKAQKLTCSNQKHKCTNHWTCRVIRDKGP